MRLSVGGRRGRGAGPGAAERDVALGELARRLAQPPPAGGVGAALRQLAAEAGLSAVLLLCEADDGAGRGASAGAGGGAGPIEAMAVADYGVDGGVAGRRIRLEADDPAVQAWRGGGAVLIARGATTGTGVLAPAGAGAGARAALPVRAGEEVVGVLLVVKAGGALPAEDLACLGAAADVIGLALGRDENRLEAGRAAAALTNLIDAVPVGLAVVDARADLERVNDGLRHLAAARPPSAAAARPPSAAAAGDAAAGDDAAGDDAAGDDALVGRPCREALAYVDEAGRRLCDWACPRTRGAAGPVGGVVRAFVGDDPARRRAVDWSCVARYDERGVLAGWVEVVEEVGRRHAVDEMRAALVSAVSHELLTPIAIIKGHAESLRAPATRRNRERAEAALTAIDEESDRLRRLVANLLDLARIQTGALRLQFAPLALPALAARAVDRFRGRTRRHVFATDFPPGFPLVLADRERLESVLYNLLDNAIKYAPRGGEIRVGGRVEGERVVVSVTDQGVGIPWGEQARIFDRYYRVRGAGPARAEGSGMGLFIVRAIVEAHGGQVWVDSRPGRGATFSFSLPREAPAELPTLSFGPTAEPPLPWGGVDEGSLGEPGSRESGWR